MAMQQRSRSGTPMLMHLRQLSPLSHASSSPGYSEGPSTPSGTPGEEHTYVERFAELLHAATAATAQAGLSCKVPVQGFGQCTRCQPLLCM